MPFESFTFPVAAIVSWLMLNLLLPLSYVPTLITNHGEENENEKPKCGEARKEPHT
jgi:hypothetical protein